MTEEIDPQGVDAAMNALRTLSEAGMLPDLDEARARFCATVIVQAYVNNVPESSDSEDEDEDEVVFLFGFDDPFEDGGLQVWVVGVSYFRRHARASTQGSASSVLNDYERETQPSDEVQEATDDAQQFLRRALRGVLYEEGVASMSCWTTDYGDNPEESREAAIERIKSVLTSRGLGYEPKLDGEALVTAS